MMHRLACLRGISTLTAFALAVDIGDWNRFIGASIGAYLGLVPSEHAAQRVQLDMRHGLVATASHLHSERAATFTRVTLLARRSDASRTSESLARRVNIRGCTLPSGLSPVKDQG